MRTQKAYWDEWWRDTSSLDSKAEKAAKLYCFQHCRQISDLDYPAVRSHAIELAKLGMDRDWIFESLLACCQDWTGMDKGEFKRRKFRKAVLRGVLHFERFADVLTATYDNGQADRYKGKDWDYFKALPPVEFLWEGILAKRTQFLLYGKPKTGKTYFALSLALTMATNALEDQEFCGLPIKHGRVLYIIAEGSEAEYRNRIDAWIRAEAKRQVSTFDAQAKLRIYLENKIRQNFRTVTVAVPINQPECVKALLEANPGLTAIAPGWELVVIDTMFRNMTGNVNDPKDSAAFGAGVDMIRETTGAAVMVLAHEGKDSSRGMFGSMLQNANADGSAKISRKGDERIFSLVELRNGDDSQDDIVYKLPSMMVGSDFIEESCYVEFVERRRKGARGGMSGANKETTTLWMIYTEQPTDVKALATILRIKESAAKRHLTELRKAGLVQGKGVQLTAEGLNRAKAFDEDDGE